LEEYAPEKIYIKGMHNTVMDAVSQLEYNPELNSTNEYTHTMHGVSTKEASSQRWKSFLHSGEATTKATSTHKLSASQ
jgi:hypothetical protein